MALCRTTVHWGSGWPFSQLRIVSIVFACIVFGPTSLQWSGKMGLNSPREALQLKHSVGPLLLHRTSCHLQCPTFVFGMSAKPNDQGSSSKRSRSPMPKKRPHSADTRVKVGLEAFGRGTTKQRPRCHRRPKPAVRDLREEKRIEEFAKRPPRGNTCIRSKHSKGFEPWWQWLRCHSQEGTF